MSYIKDNGVSVTAKLIQMGSLRRRNSIDRASPMPISDWLNVIQPAANEAKR